MSVSLNLNNTKSVHTSPTFFAYIFHNEGLDYFSRKNTEESTAFCSLPCPLFLDKANVFFCYKQMSWLEKYSCMFLNILSRRIASNENGGEHEQGSQESSQICAIHSTFTFKFFLNQQRGIWFFLLLTCLTHTKMFEKVVQLLFNRNFFCISTYMIGWTMFPLVYQHLMNLQVQIFPETFREIVSRPKNSNRVFILVLW